LSNRKDPEEEFFRLTCLSIKIKFNQSDPDFMYDIGSETLYRKCLAEKIPFHNWYHWITQEFEHHDRKRNPRFQLSNLEESSDEEPTQL
jgi:hypothetical protein